MTYDDVCAVVLTKGDNEQGVREIVRDLPYGEVVVWDNSLDWDRKVMGRYYATLQTERPVVYFQDDDVIFRNHEDLLAHYTPGVLVSNMYDEWIEGMGYFDLAMVGLGSLCDKGLWEEPFARFIDAYGWDDDRLLLDPDFIFGVLAKWRRFDFGHEILDLASDPSRLSLQPGQHERKHETISMARRLRSVVLTMMVKDEEANIYRALASSASWWDTLLLMDTGSTDRTVEIAQAFCAKHDKQIIVHPTEFEGFRESRQKLLDMGRAYGDYMLLMDADEEWTELPERPELWAEAYMIHYAGTVDWAQPRLIASRFPWKWTGDKHAYLDSDWEGECLALNMKTPLIVHHGEARSSESHAADGEILKAMVERGDDPAHDLFLLGKWYDGMKLHDDAMQTYEQRIALDLHDEEDYWCRLRLGNLLSEHANDFVASVETLLEAYKRRPTRIESLRAISLYCNAVADATPYPEDDITLVLRSQYRVT